MYWTWCIQRGGPKKVNHAAAAVGSNIYTFGGYCSDNDMPQCIDVYCFDTISLKWSKINYEITSESPKDCYGHSVVAYKYLIYLWGGQNITSGSNTLYCFNTNSLSWSIPATSGKQPKPTDGHSACVIGNYMYIFGGFEEATKSYSNKLYRINLITFRWQTLQTTGYPPSKRDFHTASVIGNRMYIFGGRNLDDSDDENYPNDIMYLDTNCWKWSTPYCDVIAPCGRRSHSAVVYKNEIYIFGGFDGINLKHLNDVFKYNTVTSVWTEMKVQGKPPCPRRRHCSVAVKDSLYLFGGSSPLDDDDDRSFIAERSVYLQEHSDLYALDFFPSLKKLATILIIENQIDINCLPSVLQNEIKWIKSQPGNTYKRRDYSAFGLNLHS